MSQNQNPDNRSASQKITDLENGLAGLYQTVGTMARDLTIAKDALKLLGSKIEAVVRAVNSSQPLTDDVISKIMVDMNVEELDQKIKEMVASGAIAPQDVVGQDSFIVGEEQDGTGKVINPRLQLGLFKIVPDVQKKFLGAKAGDVIEVSADLKFRLVATYRIVPPEQAPAPQLAAVPAPAEAAPADETKAPEAQSSSDAAPAAAAADSSAPSA